MRNLESEYFKYVRSYGSYVNGRKPCGIFQVSIGQSGDVEDVFEELSLVISRIQEHFPNLKKNHPYN